jgi:hypothetical protein
LDLAAGFFLIQRLSPPLVPDEYRHHRLVPNSYARLQQQDFSYVQRVNNIGFRGRDLSVAKPAGTYRILMLGDSFTMGKGVEDDQTFSFVLEQSLGQRMGECGGPAIEVINGGVDSYAPVLSLIALKRDLQPLEPDLVVLNLDVSDLLQESAYRREAVFGENGEIVAVPAPTPGSETLTERVRTWVDHHLFLTRALLFYTNELFGYRRVTSVRDAVTRANRELVAHTLAGDTEPRDDEWRNLFDSVLRMRDYSTGRGMDFVLSVYPWPHQVSDSEWIPGRYTFMSADERPSDRSRERIHEFGAANDIEVVDTFPAFRAAVGAEPLYFKHDNHWTVAGQRVMARGLEEAMIGHYGQRWCRPAAPSPP